MSNTDEHMTEYHEPIIFDRVRMAKKVTKNGVIEIPMTINKDNVPVDIKAALDDLTDDGVYCRISIERIVRRDEGEAPDDPNQLSLLDPSSKPPEDKTEDADDDY